MARTTTRSSSSSSSSSNHPNSNHHNHNQPSLTSEQQASLTPRWLGSTAVVASSSSSFVGGIVLLMLFVGLSLLLSMQSAHQVQLVYASLWNNVDHYVAIATNEPTNEPHHHDTTKMEASTLDWIAKQQTNQTVHTFSSSSAAAQVLSLDDQPDTVTTADVIPPAMIHDNHEEEPMSTEMNKTGKDENNHDKPTTSNEKQNKNDQTMEEDEDEKDASSDHDKDPKEKTSEDADTDADTDAAIAREEEEHDDEYDGTTSNLYSKDQEGEGDKRAKSNRFKVDDKFKDMNIVLLYADDWTFKTLGLVNPVVKTPNIDEIGRNGMFFPYNCVTTSICWQSRATLMTGLYVAVHQHVKIGSESMFNGTVTWPLTLYPLLKKYGYHVGYYGKWHAPMPQEFEKMTFDKWDNYYGEHWMWRDGKKKHITECNGEDGLRYLRHERPKNQTFHLTISFFATHAWDPKHYPDQYCHQNYTAHLYENETIPTPKTATDQHWMDMPWFFTEDNEGRLRWRRRYDTPEHYQVTMKRYYRMATEVDDVVGMIVQELKDQGVYNNTYILFTTDNGNFHAEHGIADKWYPHEESIRVPLLIQDPRMPKEVRGTVSEEFTLNIDLAPTLLSAAGIPKPDYMQGRDIADLYLKKPDEPVSPPWRKDFFYEWTQGRPEDAVGHGEYWHIPSVFALIRKDYKYFYWPQTKYEQLFHVREDPYEENDIFNITKKENAKLLKRIKSRYFYLKNMSQHGFQV